MWPGHEAYHAPPSSSKVKSKCSCTFIPWLAIMSCTETLHKFEIYLYTYNTYSVVQNCKERLYATNCSCISNFLDIFGIVLWWVSTMLIKMWILYCASCRSLLVLWHICQFGLLYLYLRSEYIVAVWFSCVNLYWCFVKQFMAYE
jgi:hypothetical protein